MGEEEKQISDNGRSSSNLFRILGGVKSLVKNNGKSCVPGKGYWEVESLGRKMVGVEYL